MRTAELEAWVIRVCEQVVKGAPSEDSRVELKSEWIPAQKAARRLAGHCNSTAGEYVLWIIGVDEKAREIVGASEENLANWYPQVVSEFGSPPPRLARSATVNFDERTVMALLFETDLVPYVVKIRAPAQGGAVVAQLEVPYREATSTRSATRTDLLRILAPKVPTPEVELLQIRGHNPAEHAIRVSFDLYVVPPLHRSLALPFHRCRGSILVDGAEAVPFQGVFTQLPHGVPKQMGSAPVASLGSVVTESIAMKSTSTELLCDGPGLVTVVADAQITNIRNARSADVEVELRWIAVEEPSRLHGRIKHAGGKTWIEEVS